MTRQAPQMRRLSGRHITIVVALVVVLAPTAVYAAERVVSVIGDPYNSSVLARVSEDGRLGVRGETTSQQGVPSNEWHRQTILFPDIPFGPDHPTALLLHQAPAGHGVGVSQLIVQYDAAAPGRRSPELWLVAKPVEGSACATADRGELREGIDELLFKFVAPHDAEGGTQYEQLAFPVPLTVPPSPTHSTCLYGKAHHGRVDVLANGVSGPATPRFIAPKGLPTAPTTEK